MRTIFTLIFLTASLYSYEQTIAPASSPTPTNFDYNRDFKMILEKTKDRNSELYYHKLLEKFLNEDSVISRAETLALMIGYTEDAHFKPWLDFQKEKEIFDMNDSADYEGALIESKTYLASHPLSLRILKERSYSYNQLKNRDSAKYFMDLVDKVMGAMIYSGKGKTAETPIFSLGLADGEYFIPNVGMTITAKNTGWNKFNHFVEIIDAMDDMGKHTNYYFVIQHAKEKVDDDEINDTQIKKPKKSKKSKSSKKDKKEAAEKPEAEVVPEAVPEKN